LGGWAVVAPADVVIVDGVTSSRRASAADLAMSFCDLRHEHVPF
jgi:hypothetical protein